MRLQKYLAACGVASRRAAEKLIDAGRVAVNGETASIGQTIDPDADDVTVDGRSLRQDEKIYIVLNKPANTVTTARDTHGRKTVLDLVEGAKARVFPVGRLDMDVEGVLLMMNDGELAHRLIHPSYQIDKTYIACVQGHVQPAALEKLAAGVKLEDGMTAPTRVEVLKNGRSSTLLRLTLHEGRKREVKRMCAAVGHPIRSLQRVSFGGIDVEGLRPGEWRYMTAVEVAHLRELTEL
ncbi:MAG: rRNA pseudouridine synthase [Candidatus Hydrogenedentes bacterium]|nr:rRNA pseudouridine synthase [Candidatus Hydrogenedentota bacterium]